MSTQTDVVSSISVNLEALGLERDESRFYVSLLQLGSASVLELSRAFDVPRTTAYRIVERLQENGLVVTNDKAGRMRVEPASPDALEKLVQRHQEQVNFQKHLLPSILGSLSNLSNTGPLASKITHYSGVEGLKQVWMNSLEAKTTLLMLTRNDLSEILDFGFAETTREESVRNQVQVRELVNAATFDAWTECTEFVANHWEARHIEPTDFYIECELLVYNDVLAIYARENDEVFCVEIRNHLLASLQRQLFNFVWKRATPMTVTDSRGAASIVR